MAYALHAQSTLENVLVSVEQNNKSIAAAKQFVEAKGLEYHTGITLENPFISADYMVGRPVSGGNQFDFQAVQPFDFPSIYLRKSRHADQQTQLLEIRYFQLKQDVLLEAKKVCIEMIYLNQHKVILAEREANAQGIIDVYEKKFELEEIGVLELNKARIQLLNIKSERNKVESQFYLANEMLATLNGGQEITIEELVYPSTSEILSFQSLADTIEAHDPQMASLRQEKTIAESAVSVVKSEALPSFEAGYHYQSVLGQTFNGFHFGLTIPLWEKKNTIRSQEAFVKQSELEVQEHAMEHHFHVKELYEKQQMLKQTIEDYRTALDGLTSEEVLEKSLNLGEIDFITYAMELDYFYNANDTLLELEKEYQLVMAELFKHEL